MAPIKRNIGIIGDGPTDRIIFTKIVECILTEEDPSKEFIDCNIIELQRQTIFDLIQKYINAEKKNLSPNPQHLVKSVTGVLISGFKELLDQVDICNCDIIILTTDSEQVLNMPDDYFNYGIKFFHILSEAAINFYGAVLAQGYPQNNIPLVLTIITFPSTEILIAAARGLKIADYYNTRPLELKQMIYNVPDARTLSEEDLKSKALDHITLKGIENIFKNIPESRHFIQTLSTYKVSCCL
ncbi:conserved hypothetical protein [Planktothrix serta PCC 8927]|uniref:Uncharacterized protein n=1 Tax=Planktothrix serta PCC 8927 TaxID=671068 RepID=A0A7Z9E5K1_9CYAN|nr:hypothetical protein [Planktothrix serta]VXD25656.1 conserved hypothetical protein [Planktothrix serta PCC 8927]